MQTQPKKRRVAIVYHSPYGHTQRVAEYIQQGASRLDAIEARLLSVDELVNGSADNLASADWEWLDQADAIILGSPAYLGSVTAGFKTFMDATSRRWKARSWSGKLAAGFANSGGLSGDKLAVLQQLNLFAMQHGMLWVGLPILPTGSGVEDLNRLSSFLGLMTQSGDAPVEETPPAGDLATAHWFGEHVGHTLLRLDGRVSP